LIMSGGELPTLPNLPGDALLDVFTHPSLAGLSDNARYSAVGEAQCKASIAYFLFFMRPPLSQAELVDKQQRWLNDGIILRAVQSYRLDTRLRCLPDRREEILGSAAELRNLFYAYMGGIVVHCTYPTFNEFLLSLIRHVGDSTIPEDIPWLSAATRPPVPAPVPTPAAKPQVKLESADGSLGNPTSPISAQQNNTARLNETATQRKVKVEYTSTSSGPSHAPTWSICVKCDGREIALGTSTDKKQAKDIAAGEALRALGW